MYIHINICNAIYGIHQGLISWQSPALYKTYLLARGRVSKSFKPRTSQKQEEDLIKI